MKLKDDEIRIVELVVRRVQNMLGETITKYICSETFREQQAEKRRFLTDVEVDFRKNLDLYLEKIKEA